MQQDMGRNGPVSQKWMAREALEVTARAVAQSLQQIRGLSSNSCLLRDVQTRIVCPTDHADERLHVHMALKREKATSLLVIDSLFKITPSQHQSLRRIAAFRNKNRMHAARGRTHRGSRRKLIHDAPDIACDLRQFISIVCRQYLASQNWTCRKAI